ncbi:hypothetical protein ACQP2K_30700 [Microbispora siamensis]
MSADAYALVESMSGEEALMFATYVAGLDARVFAAAASLVERDRAAFGRRHSEPARAVTPLYDWAAEGDFLPAGTIEPEGVPAEVSSDVKDDITRHPTGEPQVTGVPEGDPAEPEGVPGDDPETARLYPVAVRRFLPDVVAGGVPGIRRIKTELSIGQERAQAVQGYLRTLVPD